MKGRLTAGFLAALILFASTGCRRDVQPTVILVSLDGFRADYIDRLRPENLVRMTEEGAWADEGMLSVFPAKTFPNHYSIATGLYPSHHGIVSNTMYDGRRDAWFRMSDREAVEDPAWWSGEPIWVTAEKQGVIAANFYWVGSEAPVQGLQSTYWKPFDGSVPGAARVDTVLSWLDLPAERRPRFITLYFAETDSRGHWSGPHSDTLAAAVARVDAWVGRLLEGLDRRDLGDKVNVVIVSDHGMTEVSRERVVVLEDYADPRIGRILEFSPVLMWDPGSDRIAEAEAAIDRMPHVTRLDSAVLDSVFHFTGNPLIPPVVALADEGWTIVSSHDYLERRGDSIRGGTHGYDPRLPSQRALFVARGPAFVPGSRVRPFENVDIYPLIVHILGLEPAPVDGSLETVSSLLRNSP